MNTTFKPLLAGKIGPADMEKLTFPMLGSPKLDGLRVMAIGGVATSRTMKSFPNEHFQNQFAAHGVALEGLDGEAIVGDPFGSDVYERTQGPIMRREGTPDFTYWVFDRWDLTGVKYQTRHGDLTSDAAAGYYPPFVKIVPCLRVDNLAEMFDLEEAMLGEGYEGIMLRSLDGGYKYGRSTLKSRELLKLKRFEDAEAEIIGFEEEEENQNVAEKDAFGRTKRSSHQENKVGKNRLGAFVGRVVDGPFKGVTFNCGTGLNALQRAEYWARKDTLLGSYFNFSYFPIGSKDRPRFPKFKGLRDIIDFELPQSLGLST